MNRNILFISPYPRGTAPSQRFRYEQYISLLESEGFNCHFSPFWDEKSWKVLYKKGNFFLKLFGLIRGVFRRFNLLFTAKRYQILFIHREFNPLGFPWIVYILAKGYKIPIVFDFDDAVWIPNSSTHNSWTQGFRSFSATTRLISWASKVSCGNDYLKNFAGQFNPKTQLNPTTIDTENHHNQLAKPNDNVFVIGWTGSHSTIQYLIDLVPIIENIAREFPIELKVISDKQPPFQLSCLRYVPWSKENEIEELCTFHVGIMPLKSDPWSEGKCGFKALQYLSLGIPALVSPVGVNRNIVQHGKNGFLCTSAIEWENNLKLLINQPDLLEQLKPNTRSFIENHFSVNSNRNNFLALFTQF